MKIQYKFIYRLRGVRLVCLLTVLHLNLFSQIKNPADYVNPFIGATTSVDAAGIYHGLGKTFPGATTPFGLVQVSPNTITGGDNASGYSNEHKHIEGFAHLQMSGTGWYGDLGNFLVTPTTGKLSIVAGRHKELGKGYRSLYDKSTEVAKAGYYSVTLLDYGVRVEATAAPHSGFLRFKFPENDASRIQIDLARRVGGTSEIQYVKVIDEYTIAGWMKCTPNGGGFGNGEGKVDYTVYFYSKFSKPLNKYGIWSANIPIGQSRLREDIESLHYDSLLSQAEIEYNIKEKEGKHLGFFTEFETKKDEIVDMRTGISLVNIEGAKENLDHEIPDFNFDKTYKQAKNLWNKELSKIKIEGGTKDQKIIFYTSLYHTMMDPRNVSDVNGNYMAGNSIIKKSDKYLRRSIFSGWDVFRSQFPLQTIINPSLVNDVINSLVDLADETGNKYLERWELLNAYSDCMIGNPAVSVIFDAYNKGIRDFDIMKAYEYSKNTCDKFGNGDLGHSFHISKTLEYAYSEWCLSKFAKSLNKPEDQEKYYQRSLSYKNLFDKDKGWFRPKGENGAWLPWPAEGRLKQDYGTIESNPYQQGWFVPHDIDGLTSMLGGREKVLNDLISFFEKTPVDFSWNNYYNHANEPVHHVPFLFNKLNEPWLTQKWTRIICENAYKNKVEGLVGNDDLGQMSAWYILASSGLHPICPGDNRYEITSPVFDEIIFDLSKKYASGHRFAVIAKNNSPVNSYIQSAKLNGKPYNKYYISYDDITQGGTLELVMGDKPNKIWGTEK